VSHLDVHYVAGHIIRPLMGGKSYTGDGPAEEGRGVRIGEIGSLPCGWLELSD